MDNKNSIIFKCYSNNLKNFLVDNGVPYDSIVKDINNDKTIWLFIKSEKFQNVMSMYK